MREKPLSPNRPHKQILKDGKKRTASSKRWLLRQINDPYVQNAKTEGYRSRSAYKLLDLDQKFRLLKSGATVIDLGAAPGGWSQVTLKKVGTKGTIIAVDLQPMEALEEGGHIIQGDFLEAATLSKLADLLSGKKADVILSDMAAPACGMSSVDHMRIMILLEMVYDFCFLSLKPNGAMVAKVLRGGTENVLLQKLKKHFAKVVHFKPPSSRQESSEMYLVATGFRPDKIS
ncbi:MAG: RlmE family RNA methyltransferase [Alphaproteobacteria bacterium]|nr:RlmE family RNA methyltransferase [Alphaproteobacteria bacterium]